MSFHFSISASRRRTTNVSHFTAVNPLDIRKMSGNGFFLFEGEKVYTRHVGAIEMALSINLEVLA